ncbi:hypothetical protein KEM54_002790 [Ascosphaera aggregata]|nr:hypothetical protein KEM54_002790 [Ascosphaera aggregata]
MNLPQLRPFLSKSLSYATWRSVQRPQSRRQRLLHSLSLCRLSQQHKQLQLHEGQHSRHFHNSPVVRARKAPSTIDRELNLKHSGVITREQLVQCFQTSLEPFIDAAISTGVLKPEDEGLVKQLAVYTYLGNVSTEHMLEQFNHDPGLRRLTLELEAGRMAGACLVLLRNNNCAVGARKVLVDLAYLGEPNSIIFEANELLRLHGRVDDRMKERVRKVAGRGVFPQAATLYARFIEREDPEGAAAWYERAMDISKPEQRHRTLEASLPHGNMKQHWEHYLGLMTGVMQDKEGALRALKIGADKYDQSTACYNLAVIAHGKKDFETKERYLLKAAQDGHVNSCRLLGEQYTRAFLAAWLANQNNKDKIDAKKYRVPPEDLAFSKRYDQAMLQLFAEEWLKIAAQQKDNEARVRLACLLHMLGKPQEGMKELQQAEEVRSLFHSETPVQRRIPVLMRAWNDRWTGRDALITWDFQP